MHREKFNGSSTIIRMRILFFKMRKPSRYTPAEELVQPALDFEAQRR
jgi:hypothetical protein